MSATNHPRTRTLTKVRDRKGQCRSFIEFGDDFGDNSTTFHCQLPPGHDGPHLETGSLFERVFEVTWRKGKEPQP